MKNTLLIKNGVIVNSGGEFNANILVQGGKIVGLLKNTDDITTDEVINADGKCIIPGIIDSHTHMMDPGHTEREDFTTGTRAAASGGTTTIITHHRSVPPVYSVKELKDKIEYLKDKAVIDFALKGGGIPENIDNFKKMWEEGVTGFKMFTCNLHGVKAMYAGDLQEAFKEIKSLGAIALIHCEDDSIITVNEKRLKDEGRTDYLSQIEWRSALAEKVAVETVINVARDTGARVVIAHVSQPVLLEKIKKAQNEGYPIYAETCPHYLNLTIEDLEKKGPWVKFTPPMKTKADQDRMWDLFNNGYVDLISSDHCPFPPEQKKPGEENIWDAPNGIPGVETSLRLMLNAVNEGKTTLNKIVEYQCENQAKIYGLYPKKGVIAVGADADLVILDMEKEEVLSNDKIVSKCGWTPYDGLKIKGIPETVISKGNIVASRGRVLGEPGMGEFIPRQ